MPYCYTFENLWFLNCSFNKGISGPTLDNKEIAVGSQKLNNVPETWNKILERPRLLRPRSRVRIRHLPNEPNALTAGLLCNKVEHFRVERET